MPLPEEQVWRRRARDPLERDGSRGRSSLDRGGASRERWGPAPERGGVPLEGTSDPRARRNLTRGGVQPPSEVELYRGGAIPLQRSGVPPEGAWADCLMG
jgi:hypothetical protein